MAVTGTTTEASPTRKNQRGGSHHAPTDSPPGNDPLWALLSAFAESGVGRVGILEEVAVKGSAATAATAAAAAVTGTAAGEFRGSAGSRLSSRHPTGRGAAAAAAAAAGGVGTGAAATGTYNASAAASGGPLVVSVVATLRSGDARYLEEKALLEVRNNSSAKKHKAHPSVPAVSFVRFHSMPIAVHMASHESRTVDRPCAE